MELLAALLCVLALANTADAGASMHNPNFCYATDTIRPMTNMFSFFTSYEAIRRFDFTIVNPYTSTCTPTRFWYFGRYGARLFKERTTRAMIALAESSIQDDIVRNYEAGGTSLCRQDYENIRNFTMESEIGELVRMENIDMVTRSGVFAMQNISRRFQQVFPNILTQNYSPARFHFRHNGIPKANVSIRAFATGLFGELEADSVVYEPVPERDWFLRPFDFCPEYLDELEGWNFQQEEFRRGPEIQELVQQVNSKLGFFAHAQLNFTQIYTMWDWCRFHVAATFEESNSEAGDTSPWCAAFSVNHHLLLEYDEDLFAFYSTGYGVRNQRMLENLSCGVIQDLLRHMQSENDTDATARIFISNVEEIQLLLVALGTFRDVWPIHQHNFAQQSDRHWLTSLISPFSANIAVVRFDCNDGDHDLIFLLNERPILLPGCDQQTGVCKLSVVLNRFKRFVDADCSTLFCSSD